LGQPQHLWRHYPFPRHPNHYRSCHTWPEHGHAVRTVTKNGDPRPRNGKNLVYGALHHGLGQLTPGQAGDARTAILSRNLPTSEQLSLASTATSVSVGALPPPAPMARNDPSTTSTPASTAASVFPMASPRLL
jgi:hypothetical protein